MNKIQIINLKINIKLSLYHNPVKTINMLIQFRILVKLNGIRMDVVMITCSKQNFRESLLGKYKIVKIIIIKLKGWECQQLMEFQNQIRLSQKKNGETKISIQLRESKLLKAINHS